MKTLRTAFRVFPKRLMTAAVGFYFLSTGSAWAASVKYPHLTEISGKVSVTDREGKTSPGKKNALLIEKAAIETGPGSKATLQVDAHRRVQLLAATRLELPSISWETGEAPVLVLKHGTVRWRQASKGSYNIALTSDLFEFLPPEGDYLFEYDPKTATASVKVVEGHISFSATHAEDVAEVGAGQKCQFQGVKESGEVVYDVLLKGKKIPRGQLGKVLPFSAAEKKQYAATSLKQEAAAFAKKEKAAVAARESAKDPLQICKAPGARLNECAWICLNNPVKERSRCLVEKVGVSCVRRRCNANGEWAEDTEIPAEKAAAVCGVQAKVRACDY
jgi:hypothetical protein